MPQGEGEEVQKTPSEEGRRVDFVVYEKARVVQSTQNHTHTHTYTHTPSYTPTHIHTHPHTYIHTHIQTLPQTELRPLIKIRRRQKIRARRNLLRPATWSR